MRLLLIITTCLTFSLLVAGQNVVTKVTAVYDTTAVAELYNRIPVGLQLTYSNGQVRRTEGFLGGDYRWSRLKVNVNGGSFSNGYITFDRAQLAEHQYRLDLSVSLPDAPAPLEAHIILPHLTGIRFNHYADSLKRDIRFYLNVEGQFSSGRIFPLDTNTIRFETSAGALLGQDLLINSRNDSVTRAIAVKAVYKPDPSITAKTVIFVKQLPDDESQIISDQRDLYNNKRKKKKQ